MVKFIHFILSLKSQRYYQTWKRTRRETQTLSRDERSRQFNPRERQIFCKHFALWFITACRMCITNKRRSEENNFIPTQTIPQNPVLFICVYRKLCACGIHLTCSELNCLVSTRLLAVICVFTWERKKKQGSIIKQRSVCILGCSYDTFLKIRPMNQDLWLFNDLHSQTMI